MRFMLSFRAPAIKAATLVALLTLAAHSVHAQRAQRVSTPPSALANAATYAAIRDKALANTWAFERLSDLTDLIGPRLAGSAQAQAAIEQVAQAMRADGLKVTLQPMRTTHWVRGAETAEVVEYAGRPKGITQRLQIAALGGSVSTGAAGITAPVLVVHSFSELSARAKEAVGHIVLFDVPFDQELADNGHAGSAYGQAVAYRVAGASAAATVGAVAALVRAAGGANYRLTHTGQMSYEPEVTKLPSAAITAEDSALVTRLSKRGAVSLHLVLTPENLPEVDSFNVLGDLVGSEKPEEIVLISGHLDSWDLGTGAIDDGAGVAAAMGVAHIFKELKLRPKRTLRVVAFMSEENGVFGGNAYFEAMKSQLAQHTAVIESDFGAGKTLGLQASVTNTGFEALRSLREVLTPIGATELERADHSVGADVSNWQAAGVPAFHPLLDGRHYFDFHHSPADTLDKVDPKNLQRMVATLGVLAFYLTNSPEALERTTH